MSNNTVTNDLSDFGFREIAMARDLLTAYLDNNNASLLGDNVELFMNKDSGCVFLSDEDYNTAMECDGELLDWINTPYEGHEGFIEDLMAEFDDMHPEDQEYMNSIT